MSEILSNMKEKGKISTSSPIDSLIGGGVEKGCVTQFYGPPGSGKTNIALNLLVQNAKNGKNGIFVDTEGGLSIERVKQISGTEFAELAPNIIVFEPQPLLSRIMSCAELRKWWNQEKKWNWSSWTRPWLFTGLGTGKCPRSTWNSEDKWVF